jgi:hypothetical protein
MQPTNLNPMDPTVTPPSASTSPGPSRLGGVSRALATLGLAVGLLAVGGAAVVLAASPEPSASTTPGTSPSTQPSTNGSSGTTDPAKGPCPDNAGGTTPSASPSTGTS